jgi:hypothetical protein
MNESTHQARPEFDSERLCHVEQIRLSTTSPIVYVSRTPIGGAAMNNQMEIP